MKISILTLFPEAIQGYLNSSIIKKAQEKGFLEIEIINFRTNKYHQVDDYAYGGKSGMVLKIEPIVASLRENNLTDKHIISLSASGEVFNQDLARKLSTQYEHIVLICGHYEGIDARIENYISREISIGDYILTSGELSALVILDSITRIIPGVINQQSLEVESFDNNLLDFPVYTRPREFEGHIVPEIYINGNHEEIQKSRFNDQKRITQKKRPDLFSKYKKINI